MLSMSSSFAASPGHTTPPLDEEVLPELDEELLAPLDELPVPPDEELLAPPEDPPDEELLAPPEDPPDEELLAPPEDPLDEELLAPLDDDALLPARPTPLDDPVDDAPPVLPELPAALELDPAPEGFPSAMPPSVRAPQAVAAPIATRETTPAALPDNMREA
jgi:hypothetical protein